MTHCDRVLHHLRRGPKSHMELYQLGVIAHSRIAELRKKGHDISCERVGDLYVYSLLEEGEPNEPDGALAVDDGVEPSPVPQASLAAEPASPSSSGDARPDTNKGVSVVSSLPHEAAPEIDPGQLSILDLVA
jgi:hypothetical protein